MNSGHPVSCHECIAPTAQCVQFAPTEPTCTTGNNKLEPANLEEFICSPKNCSIFGGHDLDYCPDSESPRSKYKNYNPNTLGSPVGLVKSSFTIKSDGKGMDLQMQRYATYLKAFAKIYLTPENEWSTADIDALLKEGQILFTQSKQTPPSEETQTDIYSETEGKILRSFDLNEYSFQVELNEKFELPYKQPNIEKSGSDMSISTFKNVLKGFFRQAKHGLVKGNNWYLLIWKAKGVYFIFDFYGRKISDFVTDRDKGVAMLICLKTLDNVCHLVTNLSGLPKGELFNLREMKMVKLTGPDGKTISREYGKRVNEYEIVNLDYAFLKASLHLTLNRDYPLRNRSALPVGVAALLTSKIDHPATWNQRVLDRIICYGVNVCRCCWEQCLQSRDPIELDRFPDQLKLGQYFAGYLLTPRTHEGIWKCVPNFKKTELAIAIEKSFELQENYLLVQVGHQIYALWKKNNFIYLFDPYRHKIISNVPEEGIDTKSASLRMFRTFEIFLSVFTQMLLESTRTTNFFIHRLRVKKLEIVAHKEGIPFISEAPVDQETAEVKSLNDTICFEEDESQCFAELFEVSESEEEEIPPDILQMDVKEPKSETDEAEEALEEEEGGALADLGEVESSSSGDGDTHRKGTKKKSKKDKGSKKGDKGKNKKKGKDKEKGKKKKKGDLDDDIDKNKKKEKHKKKDKGKNKGRGKDKDRNYSDEDEEVKKKKTKKEKSDDGDDENKKKKKTDKDKPDVNDKEKLDMNDKDKSDLNDKGKHDLNDKGKSDLNDKGKPDPNDKGKPDINDKGKPDLNSKKKEPEKEPIQNQPFKNKKMDTSSGPLSTSTSTYDKKDTTTDMEKDNVKKETEKNKIVDKKKDVVKPEIGNDRKGGIDTKGGTSKKAGTNGMGGSKYDKTLVDDGDDESECGKGFLIGKPTNYPGYSSIAHDMAVVGSESGTYESICKLLRAGFKCADRILIMTPWGNYVIFRGFNMFQKIYFLFDGCTCNVNRFRHLDLKCGTAGLLCFRNLHDVITYIIDSQKIKTDMRRNKHNTVEEICQQYCK